MSATSPPSSGCVGSKPRAVTRRRSSCRRRLGPYFANISPPSERARHTASLFVLTYKRQSGQQVERRISGQRLWKLVKAVGTRAGIPALHPHALRHACAVELLRRTKNLRVVHEHLRHEDVQTTTGYTRITQQDVEQALETFDNDGE